MQLDDTVSVVELCLRERINDVSTVPIPFAGEPLYWNVPPSLEGRVLDRKKERERERWEPRRQTLL